MLSIKWFLGDNSNRFFLKYNNTFHVCGNESMPILKHNMQDKDKLLRVRKEVSGRQKLYLYISPIDLEIFLATLAISCFHVKFSSRITPKNMVSLTRSMSQLLISSLISSFHLFCLGLKTIILDREKFIDNLLAWHEDVIRGLFTREYFIRRNEYVCIISK